MPKVIKHGKYPEKNKVTCDECGCVFKYFTNEIDVNMTTPDEEAFFGGFAVLKSIKCPDCNHMNIISYEFTEHKSLIDIVCDKINKRRENKNGKEI